MDLNNLKPYELGQSGSKESLFYLERYLKNGTDNEKRLSASAVKKLATEHNLKSECNKLIPLLLDNLSNEKPQVRQYTLKALMSLDVNQSHISYFQNIVKFDNKDYNIELAQSLINLICKKFNLSNVSDNLSNPINNNHKTIYKDNSNQNNTYKSYSPKRKVNLDEKGYVYIIKEDFYGMYKIGKAKNLGERLNLFNVQLPFDIKLIHVIWDRNYGIIEQLLHIHFDSKRLNGEWFNLSKDDIEWIRNDGYLELVSKYNIETSNI